MYLYVLPVYSVSVCLYLHRYTGEVPHPTLGLVGVWARGGPNLLGGGVGYCGLMIGLPATDALGVNPLPLHGLRETGLSRDWAT